jgi:hypothetical protein
MLYRAFHILAVLAAVALFAPAARADSSCGGVTIPDHMRAFGVDLVENGAGIRRATIFNVHVYVAALYLEQRTHSVEDALKPDRTKLIALHFVRDVDTQEMIDALNEALEKNAGAEYASARKRMVEVEKLLPPLKDGTQLTLAYKPARGLEVASGGKVLGVVKDDMLANLVFRAWLGPRPPDKALKAGLLGAPCD